MKKFSLSNIPLGVYLVATALIALLTVGVLMLMQNISQRQQEARQDAFRVVPLSEDVYDPAQWGLNYPMQYDAYLRTVDIERTRYGGSEAVQKLDKDERWRTIWAGMPFSVDFREDRGHAYMLIDQRETERVKQFKQPGACLHCHSSVLPAYYQKGVEAGVPPENREEAIYIGFEIINPMPYAEATQLVSGPITCNDCHNPENMAIRVTRPAFVDGIQALARSDYPVPHLPSIERWRAGDRQTEYDPNTMASRQEMRSLVCAQCHVEYYFAGQEKKVVYPWHNGLTTEAIYEYYQETGHKDWTHKLTEAPSLKAQHPEFELWSQGVHAANGVACADCHMPYERVGAVKISDHHVRSPMLNINNACQTCHNQSEAEILARVNTIQDKTFAHMDRATAALVALINDIQAAKANGAPEDRLARAREFQRQASFWVDYINAENSMGFHAPQEAMR
ncbi:MAG: ammonia-forming cytochrome c nitrite reductase subunit c552, partial [Anaerolineae bacterium]|nr:ammonia-forming cytochrome c nitrite reductase subunit c552 [Anaerolineae bacterium]